MAELGFEPGLLGEKRDSYLCAMQPHLKSVSLIHVLYISKKCCNNFLLTSVSFFQQLVARTISLMETFSPDPPTTPRLTQSDTGLGWLALGWKAKTRTTNGPTNVGQP